MAACHLARSNCDAGKWRRLLTNSSPSLSPPPGLGGARLVPEGQLGNFLQGQVLRPLVVAVVAETARAEAGERQLLRDTQDQRLQAQRHLLAEDSDSLVGGD